MYLTWYHMQILKTKQQSGTNKLFPLNGNFSHQFFPIHKKRADSTILLQLIANQNKVLSKTELIFAIRGNSHN